jgi:hypothetical protein
MMLFVSKVRWLLTNVAERVDATRATAGVEVSPNERAVRFLIRGLPIAGPRAASMHCSSEGAESFARQFWCRRPMIAERVVRMSEPNVWNCMPIATSRHHERT